MLRDPFTVRADQLLVKRGLAPSRTAARRMIEAGRVRAGDAPVGKASEELDEQAPLAVSESPDDRFVSRGGLKLAGALAEVGLDVRGLVCLDVGQSTGGFSDCLLQAGAERVVGVDVGHGQLHPRLRGDARVRVLEGVNARHLVASQLIAAGAGGTGAEGRFGSNFDLIVGDLSFISLTLVLPALAPLLKPGGHLLLLVKPQFELQPADIGKGGIVRDAALYAKVEQRLRAACAEAGLAVRHWLPSPIAGGDGNREFFIHAAAAAISVTQT